MTASTSLLPLFIAGVPLAGAVSVVAVGCWRSRAGHALVAASAGAAWVLVLVTMGRVTGGDHAHQTLITLVPPLRIGFRLDPMGVLFAFAIATLFLLALVHAVGYLRTANGHGSGDGAPDRRYWRFHAWALASLACMLGIALAANLITLVVFYELFSLLAYPLIVYERTPAALRAGVKYLVYILSGGGLIFAGTVFAFHLGGSLDFHPGGIFGPDASPGMLLLTMICLVAGFGVKAALMPLHGWVADAHPAAPAPFSALLSGVMVAAGVFAILRVLFEVFGPALLVELAVLPWLAGVAGLSLVLAAVLAVAEDDLKRRLAYSTISQMAYVTLAASLLDSTALAGGLTHLVNHAFFKGGLFFCAGIVLTETGFRKVSQMRGIGWQMPWTGATLTLLALAMIGTPPLSGFIGKWTLGLGMVGAGGFVHLAVMLFGSLLAALYLWPVLYQFWRQPGEGQALPRKAHDGSAPPGTAGWMLAAVLAAGLLTVILGVAARTPGFPLDLAGMAGHTLLGAAAWN